MAGSFRAYREEPPAKLGVRVTFVQPVRALARQGLERGIELAPVVDRGIREPEYGGIRKMNPSADFRSFGRRLMTVHG